MPPLGAQGLRAAPGSPTAACPPSHVAMRSRAFRPHISMYGHRPVWGPSRPASAAAAASSHCWPLAGYHSWQAVVDLAAAASGQQQPSHSGAAQLHSAIYSMSYPGQPSSCH